MHIGSFLINLYTLCLLFTAVGGSDLNNIAKPVSLIAACRPLDDSMLIERGWSWSKAEVSYAACCGLGHRLSRTIHAYVLSIERNDRLLINWGLCGTFPIFDQIFAGSSTILSSTSLPLIATNISLIVNNQAPGFEDFMRTANVASHPTASIFMCTMINHMAPLTLMEYMDFSQTTLRPYFTNFPLQSSRNNEIPTFVIGIHFRHGNGEIGDFSLKKRDLFDLNESVLKAILASRILALNLSKKLSQEHSIIKYRIFLATDSIDVVTAMHNVSRSLDFFQSSSSLISGVAVSLEEIFTRDQIRPESGSGVLYGQSGTSCTSTNRNPACFLKSSSSSSLLSKSLSSFNLTSSSCLSGFIDIYLDMLLLSSCDAVIGVKFSSFLYAPHILSRVRSIPFCIMINKLPGQVDDSHCPICVCNPVSISTNNYFTNHLEPNCTSCHEDRKTELLLYLK